jgi:Zn-dependent protease
MKWSFRVGRIAGIDLYIHLTFFALLALLAFLQYQASGGLNGTLIGVGFFVAVFGIIVLHELGHALAARRYGVATRDITLYPIGGVARLERIPENPRQELVIALAGPAVNVVIAAAVFGGLVLGFGLPTVLDLMRSLGGSFLGADGAPSPTGRFPLELLLGADLVLVNVGLVVFNMIPAFPMDGGRVLRAILAMRMDYQRATQIAATVGQIAAVGFALLGLLGGVPMLAVIAFFVWMGAGQEAANVRLKAALSGIPVHRAMVTDFRVLSPDETLRRAAEGVFSGFQSDFPVVQDGRPVGILTRADVIRLFAAGRLDAFVGEAMQSRFETADPYEMLDAAFSRLQRCETCRTLLVVHEGRPVGMLIPEKIGDFLAVQSAVQQALARAEPPTPAVVLYPAEPATVRP